MEKIAVLSFSVLTLLLSATGCRQAPKRAFTVKQVTSVKKGAKCCTGKTPPRFGFSSVNSLKKK